MVRSNRSALYSIQPWMPLPSPCSTKSKLRSNLAVSWANGSGRAVRPGSTGAPAGALGEVDDHHLEQRVAGQGAARVECLDQALEGQFLVLVRGQVGSADAAQHLGEARVAGQVGAQHEGVDEEADQVLQALVAASGDGRAERDVVARAEPVEQGGDGGLGDHEHAGALAAGERAQGAFRFGPDREAHGAAGVRGLLGARPVGGQRQFLGESAQGLGPVREEIVAGVLQQLALPEGVVGVTHRQRGPVGRTPGGARGVGGAEAA